MDKKIVFVGMSGGVDSSVAALLLKRQGYDVVGVFMRCYNLDGCAERDAEDARRVAEHIGIPFYVWDFEEEYKKRVVEYMIEGYRAGITPNPDVMCNREIKFGLFLKKAISMGADYIATGHYVRLLTSSTNSESVANQRIAPTRRMSLKNLSSIQYSLAEAKDKNKDQSYFLWTLTQNELKHCLFPIGDYVKPKVREIARKAGLPTAEKKDSQGVCFLGDVNVEDFLRRYVPTKKGALMTTAGEQIGTHHGAEFYTIGERHINADFKFPKTGGKSDRKPFYVASKDVKTNVVTVAEGDEHPALYRNEVRLANVNFINPHIQHSAECCMCGVEVFARVRYRQPLAKAKLIVDSDKRKADRAKNSGCGHPPSAIRYKLIFDKPQKFIAPGQSAVFYDKNGVMLGGGIIL
jgi:tRNA-specific 2-thiouridylase